MDEPVDDGPGRAGMAWRRTSAGTHLALSAAAGILVGIVVALTFDGEAGALTAWVASAAVFLIWTWTTIWPLNARETALIASREDASRPVRDIVLLLVAIGTVFIVGAVIFRAHGVGPARLLLGVASIAMAWLVLHTIFVITYARLYYSTPKGGVDFGQDEEPSYQDFAYLGFTVGMTFQVSDTNIGKRAIRSAILRHALLSFLFGTVILAVTVNLLAGFGT